MAMTTSARMMNIFIFPNPAATPTEPFPIPTAVVRLPSANALADDAIFSPVTPPIDTPGEGAGVFGVFPKLSPPKLLPKLSFPKLLPKLSPPKLFPPKLLPKLSFPKLLPKLLPNSFNAFSAAISILIILLFILFLFLFRICLAHWVLKPRGWGWGAWFGIFFVHAIHFKNKIVI